MDNNLHNNTNLIDNFNFDIPPKQHPLKKRKRDSMNDIEPQNINKSKENTSLKGKFDNHLKNDTFNSFKDPFLNDHHSNLQEKKDKRIIGNLISNMKNTLKETFNQLQPVIGIIIKQHFCFINKQDSKNLEQHELNEQCGDDEMCSSCSVCGEWSIEIVNGQLDFISQFLINEKYASLELALFLVERNLLKILKIDEVHRNDLSLNDILLLEQMPIYTYHELFFMFISKFGMSLDLYQVFSHVLKSGSLVRKRCTNKSIKNLNNHKSSITNHNDSSQISLDCWYFDSNSKSFPTKLPDYSIVIIKYFNQFPSPKECHKLFESENQPIYFCSIESGMMNFILLKNSHPFSSTFNVE